MALGQGTAPAVLHSLVSMPLGLASAHTKTCGQITVVAGTATVCIRGNIPQDSTARNCSFSIKYEGGSERGKKNPSQLQSITISLVSVHSLAACLSPGARCLFSGVIEGLLS